MDYLPRLPSLPSCNSQHRELTIPSLLSLLTGTLNGHNGVIRVDSRSSMANSYGWGLLFLFSVFLCIISSNGVWSIQILAKSKLEKCERSSGSNNLNCTRKIVINMAVPSGSSGGEASMVAEVVEVEDNSTDNIQTLRVPPLITINKTSAYALYELTYIRDVPYKPEEFYVQTRKCEPDADAKVVQICERLYDGSGHVIEHTQPVCCPCGDQRRVPSSCGNFFDTLVKGKPNSAHCLRFPGDWFHVFSVGQRSIGFTVRVEVKSDSKVSEVIVGPDNRTATSDDSFLRVNLVGDFAGYSSIPSFENFYLVIPRQGGEGQPQDLGKNISMWMVLERVRFTLDGLECNKIGVSYEAFNGQPDFCSSPFWSCLHNQLWNFHEADQNRLSRDQVPLYGVEHKFERINQHPNAGSHSFSIGITEVLNTNLLIELRADDIEYVYQRSPGKIRGITTPNFEALSQVGTSTISAMNTGEVEASYSLTFSCSQGVTTMEEQFFIMKRQEMVTRTFKIHPSTDQAVKYTCTAILKDSEFQEVDRADCQFTTTATVLENGTQIAFTPPKSVILGFFDSIKEVWNRLWNGLMDFITGKSCRNKCSAFFDFSCHIQYICMSWIIVFGLFLAIFPTVLVLLWLLHQKGLFDPLYDWWEIHCMEAEDDRYRNHHRHKITDFDHFPMTHCGHKRIHGDHPNHHHHHHHHYHHVHEHPEKGSNFKHTLQHVHKNKHHRHKKHTHRREEKHQHRREKDVLKLRKIVIEDIDGLPPKVNNKHSPQLNHLM